MKTSNKISVLALIIIVFSLVFYDFGLKATYKKGDYRSRFYKMEKIDLANFNSIENYKANILNLKIEQGPEFCIWLKKEVKDRIFLNVKNKNLRINFKSIKGRDNYLGYDTIIVICPALKNYTSKDFTDQEIQKLFKDGVVKYQETISNFSLMNSLTTISGYDQDSLTLKVNPFTKVLLKSIKLDNLKALIGDKNNTNAILTIKKSNTINNVDLTVLGKNTLNIEDANIKKASFNLSEKAELTLIGKSLELMKQ